MTPRIPLSLIALPGKATWLSFLCLKISDIILIPVLGCFGIAILWSVIHSFLTTLMPTPTLPMMFNSSLTLYRLFRNYLEVMSLIEKSANVVLG